MSAQTIENEIVTWSEQQEPHYYDTAFEHFWQTLEWKDIELPSGLARHVDVQSDEDESLGIFSVDGEHYALRGSYSSWGSDWDSGVHKVDLRAVTLQRWTIE